MSRRQEKGKRRSALRAAADFLTAKEIGRGRIAARPFFRIPPVCALSFLPSALCWRSLPFTPSPQHPVPPNTPAYPKSDAPVMIPTASDMLIAVFSTSAARRPNR